MTLPPQRIISLVPSLTELLFYLQLNDEVVGITKFCVHPIEWFKIKTRIGGTKNINIEKIKSLKPDLVIANKEENIKEQVETLQDFTKVYVSDVSNLGDTLKTISAIGKLIHKKEAAQKLAISITEKFSTLKILGQPLLNAAYLIWQKPFMAAGGDTFIHDMMQYCGLRNIFENRLRYPETTIDELRSLNCDVLLLSSEPFPFDEKHAKELQPYLPQTKILLIDGEMFSWYGSRLLQAADYFKELRKSLSQQDDQ